MWDHNDERFAPYRRRDYYGTNCQNPWTLADKVRIAVLSFTLAPVKFALAVVAVLCYYIVCRVVVLLSFLPVDLTADVITTTGRVCARLTLLAFGFVKVNWVEVAPEKDGPSAPKAAAIVSNHLSYTDILVHVAHYAPSFAARDGTQNLPCIGLISRCLQCLYVVRENKQEGTKGIAEIIKTRMEAKAADPDSKDRPMLLFPEGTTTNGDYLLSFKTGAFLAGLPVQPVIMKFGEDRISPSWDTFNIKMHIWLMLCEPLHSVTCWKLPVYVPSPEEQADPKLYATNVRNLMLKYGKLKSSESTLNDKWDFFKLVKEEAAARRRGKAQHSIGTNGHSNGIANGHTNGTASNKAGSKQGRVTVKAVAEK